MATEKEMGGPPPIPVAALAKSEPGNYLLDSHGVVIRQHLQVAEIVAQALTGLPCEKANIYDVGLLPTGRRAIHAQNDPEGWRPTYEELVSLPKQMQAREQSSCMERFLLGCFGVMNLRSMIMPFYANEGVVFTMERPLNLGGFICCPHTSYVHFGSEQRVGRVQEDVHCGKNYCLRYCQAACCCTAYYDLSIKNKDTNKFDPAYQLELNLCCFGPHNNLCGSTCIKNDSLYNIYKYEGNQLNKSAPAGYLQKTFGNRICGESSARCLFNVTNYIVEYPQNISEVEKAVFIAAAMTTEYVYFERKGDE